VRKLFDGVSAVVPQVAVGMGAADRTRVAVVNVLEAGGYGLLENVLAGTGHVRTIRKILVAIQHHALVPRADFVGIGLRKVQAAIGVEAHERKRVVHNGSALLRTRGEIVLDADRVSYLVRR